MSPSSANISAGSGSVDFSVISNINWTFSEDADWFIAQKADDGTLSVDYIENLSVIARSATITITGPGVNPQTISINQQGATPYLSVDPESATVSPVQGIMTFTVSSNIEWSVTTGASWISVTKTSNTIFEINYNANTTVTPRSAVITLSGPGVTSQTVNFNQEGEDPVLSIVPLSTTVSSSSGSYSFTITSNISWSVSEDASWLTVTKTNNSTLTVNYNENILVTSRSAGIVVSGPGVESQTITLNQQGANPELSIEPPSASVQASSGSLSFTVTSNVDWSVSENSTWLTATKTNASTINVSYDENTIVNSRSSTITVSGPGVSSQLVTVTQGGATPVLTVSPSSQTVNSGSGSISFDVQSNIEWNFSENSDWFIASKTDPTTLTLTFDENLSVTPRSANISLSGPGVTARIVSLSQNGAEPILTVNPTSADVNSDAGSVSFNVTSNIYWNYSETYDWIQIMQSDYNTLIINYDANNSPGSRSGTITLSGTGVSPKTITITQTGSNPKLDISPVTASVTSYPGSVTIEVDANIEWTFEESADWLSASKINNSNLVVNYNLNSSFESRSATILISGPGVPSKSYVLTQLGTDPVLSVYQPFANVSSTSGTVNFSVKSNINWVISEDYEWVTAVKTNASTLTVSYDLNLLFEPRTAIITLSGPGVNDQTVTLVQEKSGAILTVNPASETVAATSGTVDFVVSSNINWSISENIDWFEAVKANDNTLRVNYNENFQTESRTETVTLSGEGVNPVSVTIIQTGATALITVDPLSATVSSSSGTINFTVTSNVNWNISENSGWLAAIKSDETTLTVSYNENDQVNPRTANIILTGEGAEAVTISINQQGSAVTLEVSPLSATVSSDEGTYTFTVNSNIEWTVSTDQDWLTVTKVNETSFDATYQDNSAGNSRTGSITVSGEGASPVVISLTQEAPTAILTLAPEISLKLYPNPSRGFVNLEIKNLFKDKIIIEIFNKVGQKLYEKVYNYPPHVITENYNFNDWPKGEYYLRIHDSKEWRAVKIFIIQ